MSMPRSALGLLVSLLVAVTMMGRPTIDAPDADALAGSAASSNDASASERAPAPQRPAMLLPMYVSFAALQALDIHSTLRAPAYGGREANPIVDGMLGSPAAFVAVKAGMTAAVYYASERLWKRNKAAAIVTMIGLNCAYTTIVAHNYAVEARAPATR